MRLTGTLVSRTLVLVFSLGTLLSVGSCALTATRPVQEMSDTSAAIRAAREVQADTLAPELYRQANEWFFKARNDYKLKNFSFAKDYAIRARQFAEKAEFESIKSGGNRVDVPADQPGPVNANVGGGPGPAPTPVTTPYDYPTPQGTPAEEYDQRKAQEDSDKKAAEQQQAQPTPAATETPAVLAPPPIIINNTTPTLKH